MSKPNPKDIIVLETYPVAGEKTGKIVGEAMQYVEKKWLREHAKEIREDTHDFYGYKKHMDKIKEYIKE